LNPHSIKFKLYLVNIFKERYDGNDWEQEYLDLIKINMQELLDRTTQGMIRISLQQKIEIGVEDFEMMYKWGCDSSSGHVQYKQIISNDTSVSDSNLFLFSIVPIQLCCTFGNGDVKIIIWQNNWPSSTR